MRRITVVFSVVFILFLLAGCVSVPIAVYIDKPGDHCLSSKESAAKITEIACVCPCEPGSEAFTPTPTAASKKRVWTYREMAVGFAGIGSESDWRAANIKSFREVAQQLGITLKFSDAQAKTQNQFSAVRAFIEDREINVIVITALEPTGWDEVLNEAKEVGKIVILADRRIDAPKDLYATHVGSDFTEEGRKAGRAMIELLKDSPKKTIVELVGSVGSYAAKERGQGFREAIAESGIEMMYAQTGNWNATEGKTVMEAWLKETRDIQGVFAQNDEMALGAIEAIKEAGLKPGVDIKLVSIDATRAAFEAMIAGELNVTVECNPLLAPQVYEAALKVLNGEVLPKFIPTMEDVFWSTDPNLVEILKTRAY